MQHCYSIETIYNIEAMFPLVDATYVIHLKGNGRYNDVKKQLDQYPFTKVVHIVLNEGYKKCKKLNIDSTMKDIVDANLYCMNHANEQNYDNILILEDDFIVNNTIHEHTDNINAFVRKHSNQEFVYRLGCIPGCMFPYDRYNYTGTSLGAHAVMYSNRMRSKILKTNELDDWDDTLNTYTTYIYYTPIIYQLFPQTENKKNWGGNDGMFKIHVYIIYFIINILHLDKQVEPGYSIIYFFAKWWIILLLLISFIILRLLYVK